MQVKCCCCCYVVVVMLMMSIDFEGHGMQSIIQLRWT